MTRRNNMINMGADKQHRVGFFKRKDQRSTEWKGNSPCVNVEMFRNIQFIIYEFSQAFSSSSLNLYELYEHIPYGHTVEFSCFAPRKKYDFLSIAMWYHSFWWISKMLVRGAPFNARELLGGGFNSVWFSPFIRERIQFEWYFWDGLKPPTSCFDYVY